MTRSAIDTQSRAVPPDDVAVRPSRAQIAGGVAVAGVVLVGVGLRFVARSPLWLDEALTVNIAKLPAGEIPKWLRHDGHPPLYYELLHVWMKVFGSSDRAVRALSGVFGVILLPLVWLAGRRLGGRICGTAALLVVAVSPYAVRYSTEARMYSLVMVLVVAGWLIGQDALADARWWRLVALVVLSALLLWTHYWGMWFLAAAGLGLVVRAWRCHRRGETAKRRRTVAVIGALVVGGLAYLPWLPSLLYQARHTGTPWAHAVSPATVLGMSALDFGGGINGEAIVVGLLLVLMAAVGLFGRAVDRYRIDLDLRTQFDARRPVLLIAGTLVLAELFSYSTNSAFATRYDAVWFPFFVFVVGLGFARFSWRPVLAGSLVVLVALSLVSTVRTATRQDRTQAGDAAHAIAARARPGDVVVTCPDQLGPSLSRELPAGLVEGTYPAFASPRLVDWADYTERLARADPRAFAQTVLRRAGNHQIFLAWSASYITHKYSCTELADDLLRSRPGGGSIFREDPGVFEHETVYAYPAP